MNVVAVAFDLLRGPGPEFVAAVEGLERLRAGHESDVLHRVRARCALTLESSDIYRRILARADSFYAQSLQERLAGHYVLRKVVDHVRVS